MQQKYVKMNKQQYIAKGLIFKTLFLYLKSVIFHSTSSSMCPLTAFVSLFS
jgi:hypothetical protein